MKLRWDLEDGVRVELEKGAFRKAAVTVNGAAVDVDPYGRRETPLPLPGGRQGLFLMRRRYVTAPLIQLTVDGKPVVEAGDAPEACPACGAKVKASDRFCAACGHTMPPPEHYWYKQHNAGTAPSSLWIVAAIFGISAVVMFFVTRSSTADLLAEVNVMRSSAVVHPPGGGDITAGELRHQLTMAPWTIFGINMAVAVVMAGLGFWARRAALAAAIIAGVVYTALLIAGGFLDPASIGDGVAMKIVIIAMLGRAIQGGVAQRRIEA